jgi:ketosteroid isomerase-like protein
VSREYVEIVRRASELLAAGDVDAAAEMFHPDARLEMALGTFVGRQGLKRWQAEVRETLGNYEFLEQDYLDAGDVVVILARVHGRGQSSGLDVDQELGWVMVVQDGLIVSSKNYRSPHEALEAAGLSGQ